MQASHLSYSYLSHAAVTLAALLFAFTPAAYSKDKTATPSVTKAFGLATSIETNNEGNASDPQIAIDAKGNALVVWVQHDGKHFHIWSNRYTLASGWGTATLIEHNNAGHASDPQIAVDGNGNALAVWAMHDGSRKNIWSNRFVLGTGWGTATLIENNDVGDASNPQIAIDGNGNALAVWRQFDGTHFNIRANRFTADTGWGAAELIETDNAGDAVGPQIALDANSNALAVWRQSDGTRYNIWANRFTAGAGWGTAELIETDNAGDAKGAHIAFDAKGNALAVWRQSDGKQFNIWINRYTTGKNAGNSWGTATLIMNGDAINAAGPKIAFDNQGNALVVWRQSKDTRSSIWANRLSANNGWGAAVLIESDDSGDAIGPQIAFDKNGNALVVWRQSDGKRFHISANRYTPSKGWGKAMLIESNNAGDAVSPQIAFDTNGNAIVVWSQFDGKRTSIRASRYQ